MQQLKFSSPSYQLPSQLTPFINRSEDLAEIAHRLADPACRLLTLVGPGGMGKTRLALETAARVRNAFPDGIYFVTLQTIQTVDLLLPTIADVVGVAVANHETLSKRLSQELGDKRVLVVLDNFEQLLPMGSAEVVADLLIAATSLKFLITSREVLKLQEEWLFPVQGLPYPLVVSHPLNGLQTEWPLVKDYPAIQLFVACARRVQLEFTPADEASSLVRIAQLVQGMPLALELAASWVKTLPCREIVAEIEHDLNFLTSSLRNTPERHRSMQVVFNHSWAGLTAEEQLVFKRLAVFRGGFRRQAAEVVAEASLAILSSLVDKSLLRCDSDGRYQVHELLRQYAADQFAYDADDATQTYSRHSVCYTNFLYERTESLMGKRQSEVLSELHAELDNIRAAWAWAVAHKDVANLGKAAYTLCHFCNLQGRFREGIALFESAITQLDDAPTTTKQQDLIQRETTLAHLNALLGFLYPRLGRYTQSQSALERSCTLYQQLNVEPLPGLNTEPTLGLALLHNILGNYAKSHALAETARQRYETRGNHDELLMALFALGDVAIVLGDYRAARRYVEQGYALAEALGNRWQMATMRRDLGRIARCEGDTKQARQQLQGAFALMEANHDPEAMAVVLNHLGKTAWLEGAYTEAEEFYQRSLALYYDLDDRGGLGMTLAGLGATLIALGQIGAAHTHLRQALSLAASIGWARLMPEVLVGISHLFQRLGQPARSVALLTFVLQDAGALQETRQQAHRCLRECQQLLSADQFAAATQQGLAIELTEVLAVLPAELIALEELITAAPLEPQLLNPTSVITSRPAQPLVEPLTNRELEVLQLIADGLSNQQIADKLVLSLGTVKFYAGQIYGKLGVNSRVQAILQARDLALLN